MPTAEQQLAEKVLKYMEEQYGPTIKAFEKADVAFAEARVKIGEYLFKEFCDDKIEEATKKKYAPSVELAVKIIVQNRDCPEVFKSETMIRNLVHIGVQSKFLKEKGIELDKLITLGKIGYTHLVRLSHMDDGDEKVKLVLEMGERKEPFKVKELEAEIKKRTKATGQTIKPFELNFETIMTTAWTQAVIKENYEAAWKGKELSEEDAKSMLGALIKDLKTVSEKGYDKEEVNEARGTQMEKILRDAANKAKDYLNNINAAIRKLEEKKEKKPKGQRKVA